MWNYAAGGTIALQAEIINEPSEVHWFCEKVPIVLNDKARSIYDHGVYSLIISEATKEQSGQYVCIESGSFLIFCIKSISCCIGFLFLLF